MGSLKRKIASAAISIAAGVAAATSVYGAQISNPELIKTVTKYEVNFESMDWEKVSEIEYEYDGEYPISSLLTEYDNPPVKSSFEYTMKDGIPAEMKQYDEGRDVSTVVTYMENGRIDRIMESNTDKTYTYEKLFVYPDDDAYFTLVFHERTSSFTEGDSVSREFAEEADQIVVTQQNGLLQKTVNNGIYANWDDETPKEWVRFNGQYTADYDEDGIVSKTSGLFRHYGSSGDINRFTAAFEDGRITQIIKEQWGQTSEKAEGEWKDEAKYVFTYTDIPISKARYASMINAHIVDEDNNFYIYNWY